MAERIFLLSPANSGGLRARLLLRPEAKFELAQRVREGAATLGEVFSFCSGLYFRGKLAYARRFAQPPKGVDGAQVITPHRGLVSWDTKVGVKELTEFAAVPVCIDEPRYVVPLEKAARTLANLRGCEFVLLGSIATEKYVKCLLPQLGERLLFPADFVGRGDMSRGGLLLRCVSREEELRYIAVSGAIRKGARPPKLTAGLVRK